MRLSSGKHKFHKSGLVVLATIVGLIGEPLSKAAPEAIARGDAALDAGQPTQAIEAYQDALISRPGDSTLFERLYRAAHTADRPDLAAVYLYQTALIRGWTPPLYRQMAELMDENGDIPGAAAYWRASLEGTREDIPALRQIADYALRWRDWEGAEKALAQLAALDPTDSSAAYRLGLLLAATTPRAAPNYLNQAARDPLYAPTVQAISKIYAEYGNQAQDVIAFRIGLALINLGAWPYAERALTVAIAKGPGNPAALAFLGLTQDQQGRDGWPLLVQAQDAAPNDPLVNYAVGVHWRLKGDTQKAITALTLARTLDPNNAAIAAEIGMAYRVGGFLQEASLWLNTAVALAPTEASFRALLANFYADENYDLSGRGLLTIRQIAQGLPNNADVQASLGWALLASGQYDAAQAELQKALQLDPHNTRARYYFGVLLEYRGDSAGAADAYRHVYREDKSAFRERAARALERLGVQP